MRFLRRLAALLNRRRFDAELEEEIQFHLDHTTPQRRLAMRRLTSAMNPLARYSRLRQSKTSGATFATWRTKSAAQFRDASAAAVLSLGRRHQERRHRFTASSTRCSFTMFRGVEPERLVRFNGISYPNYNELRGRGIFEDLAGWNIGPPPRWRDRRAGSGSHRPSSHGEFFRSLGRSPGRLAVGCLRRPRLRRERDPRVVVISHRFWQRRLNADPNVLGRTRSN